MSKLWRIPTSRLLFNLLDAVSELKANPSDGDSVHKRKVRRLAAELDRRVPVVRPRGLDEDDE